MQTLRYYERRGLLARPDRNAAGHRCYPARTVTLLRMIKNAHRLGISLGEIAGLMKSGPGQDSMSAIAQLKLAEVDAHIARLTSTGTRWRATRADRPPGCLLIRSRRPRRRMPVGPQGATGPREGQSPPDTATPNGCHSSFRPCDADSRRNGRSHGV